MPINQEQYSQNQLDLIFSQNSSYQFDETKGDFVKLSIYYTETGVFYGSFASNNILPNGMPEITPYYTFTTDADGNEVRKVYIRPNEILKKNNIPSGNYRLVFDFLRDITKTRYLQPENLVIQSQTFNTDAWTPASDAAIVTLADESTETTAPDGSPTAWKLDDDSSGINHYIVQTIPSAVIANDTTKTYIASIYLKKGTAFSTGFKIQYGDDGINTAHVAVNWTPDGSISDLTGSGASYSQYIDVGNGWYRILTTRQYDGTTGDTLFKVWSADWQEGGTEYGTVYAWGAQIQAGTVDEGYIPTTDAIVEIGLSDDLHDSWVNTLPRYILSEVAPSTREIRLIGQNETSPNSFYFTSAFRTFLNEKIHNANPGTNPQFYPSYAYDKVLGISYGRLIPINSFTFDNSHPDADLISGLNVSLILRLNQGLPGDIPPLSTQAPVYLYKKLINTQIQDIIFVSDVTQVSIGDGLTIDDTFGNDLDESLDNFQNEDELILTASISDVIQEDIQAAQADKYVNLNVDFNNFSNHTFFGSATSKVENFKDKVTTIQKYLTEISSSLVSSGSHINNLRKANFEKIKTIKNNFTPYEQFLYYDNQTTSTGSAPGLGKNYGDILPVNTSDTGFAAEVNNVDGFSVVYKHTNDDAVTGTNNPYIDLFTGKYYAQSAPFFNYSSSIYLSFLARIESGSQKVPFVWENRNTAHNPSIPADALQQNKILDPNITGSEYRRVIYAASQSFWRPSITTFNDLAQGQFSEVTHSTGHTSYEILSGSNITGSYPLIGAPNNLPYYPEVYSGSAIGPEVPFSGSVMPAGELFRIFYQSGSAVTASLSTDVKITLKDPTNTMPFTSVYSTGSSEWTGWYDRMYLQAEKFDEDNIHSLTNNLPEYIKERTDSTTLKKFINLWGEQFDVLRMHVDNYSSLTKRNYKPLESVPANLLPILGKSMGWDMVNPYSGSLSSYFEGLSYADNINEIGNATWRKTLNNLIYLYKTKGTANSINALLNIYGYPSDFIAIDEYGGSLEPHNPEIITSDISNLKSGVGGTQGNVSFNQTKEIFYMMNLSNNNQLRLDWHSHPSGSSLYPTGSTIEFMFAGTPSNQNQTLMRSSGGGSETMWRLNLITGSSAVSGALQFHLNTAKTGSGDISDSTVHMETSYLPLKNGDPWHVMLRKNYVSSVQSSYNLITGVQDTDKISEFVATTSASAQGMTVLDTTTNDNFSGTGSLNNAITSGIYSGSNLYVGENFTGSIAEIRLWAEELAVSKFKQHILDPFNVVGNSVSSSTDALTYRYRLAENYASGTVSPVTIVDASIHTNIYDKGQPDLTNDDFLYNSRKIDVIRFVLRTGGTQKNKNKIMVDPGQRVIRDLSPRQGSVLPLGNTIENKRRNSKDITIVKSVTEALDNYTINKISDFDLTEKYGKPEMEFSSSYDELNTFKEKIHKDVKININEFIRANSKVFTPSLVSSIERALPARSLAKNVGILYKDDVLTRHKVRYHRGVSIHSGSAAGFYEFDLIKPIYTADSMTVDKIWDMSSTELYTPYAPIRNISYVSGSDKIDFSNSAYIPTYKSNLLSLSSGSTKTYNLTSTEYISTYDTNNLDMVNNHFNVTSSVSSPYETNGINLASGSHDLSSTEYLSVHETNVINQDTLITKDFTYVSTKNGYILLTSGSDAAYTLTDSSFNTPYTGKNINVTSGSDKVYDISDSSLNTPYKGNDISFFSSSVSVYDLSNSSFSTPYKANEINVSSGSNKLITLSPSIHTPYKSNDINMATGSYDLTNSSYLSTYDSEIGLISGSKNNYDLSDTSYIATKDGTYALIDTAFSESAAYFTTKDGSTSAKPTTGADFYQPQNASPINVISGSNRLYTLINSFSQPYKSNDVNMTEIYELTGSDYVPGHTGNIHAMYDGTSYTNKLLWQDEYGNDYHIINPMVRGVDDDYNTGYIERSMHFIAVGDVEVMSSSLNQFVNRNTDWTNQSYFKNTRVVNSLKTPTHHLAHKGAGYGYRSYINISGDTTGEGRLDARPLGKTAYFSASADGTIYYPDNHHIHFHTVNKQLKLYEGTVNGATREILDEELNRLISTSASFGQDPLKLDPNPSQAVSVVNVAGSDAGNILKVDKLDD